MRSIGIPFVDKDKLQAFLKEPLLKAAGELLNLSRKQLRIIIELLTGHCHFKGHLLQPLKQPHTFFVTVRH
jgi:hypothetical protein